MSGRSIRAGNAFVEVSLRDKGVKGQLRKLQRRMTSFGSTLSKIGAVGLGGLAAIGTPLIALAATAQEVNSKFDTVFGSLSDSTRAWSEQFANDVGRSETEMLKFLASTQDLLVPMGFASGDAAGMSKEIAGLAVDLASFNDMSDADTLNDLQAALTGSGEVMKKYGVIVSAAAVKQQLLSEGIDAKDATEQQKAYARWKIILTGTTSAQGDAIKTAGSFTNQMKRLRAQVIDSATAIGAKLLPIVTPIITKLGDAVSVIKEWVSANPGLVSAIVGAGAAFAVISAGLLSLGAVFAAAGVVIGGLVPIIGLLMSPIGLVIGGLAGLGAAFLYYTDFASTAIDYLKERFGPLVETVQDAAAIIMDAFATGDFSEAWDTALMFVETAWLDLTNNLMGYWDTAMNYLTDATAWVAKAIGSAFEKLGAFLQTMLDGYASYYDAIWNTVTEKIGEASGVRTIGGPVKAFEQDFGGVAGSLDDAFKGIENFGATMQDAAENNRKASLRDVSKRDKERRERLASNRKTLSDQATVVKEEQDKKLKKASDFTEKASDGVKDKKKKVEASTAGTFNAVAAIRLGMGNEGNAQERTAKATEKMVENQEITNRKLDKIRQPAFG